VAIWYTNRATAAQIARMLYRVLLLLCATASLRASRRARVLFLLARVAVAQRGRDHLDHLALRLDASSRCRSASSIKGRDHFWQSCSERGTYRPSGPRRAARLCRLTAS
jgi:hypothetical protein